MPPKAITGSHALCGACVCTLSGLQGRGLVPPHIVPLHPAANMQREVLVGRFKPGEQAVFETALDVQVAADLIAFLCSLRLFLLFLQLLLSFQLFHALVHDLLDVLLAELPCKGRIRDRECGDVARRLDRLSVRLWRWSLPVPVVWVLGVGGAACQQHGGRGCGQQPCFPLVGTGLHFVLRSQSRRCCRYRGASSLWKAGGTYAKAVICRRTPFPQTPHERFGRTKRRGPFNPCRKSDRQNPNMWFYNL